MTEITLWIMLGILVPIVLITSITPLITRKIEAFGVTVPDGIKQEGYVKKHINSYVTLCAVLGAIVIVLLYILMSGNMTEQAKVMSYTIAIFVYLIITFGFYYKSHRAIKAWKQTQSWYTEQISSQKIVVQTGFHSRRKTISLFWYLPHLGIIIFTMIYSLLNYDKFPDTIPMQYDFNGEITRTVEKSVSSVLSLSVIAFVMLVVFIISHISISKAKQLVESKDPEGSLERNRQFRYAWSIFLTCTGFLVIFMMCMGQFSTLLEWPQATFMMLTFVIVSIILVGAIGLSVYTGQGGSRIKLRNEKETVTASVADQDQYWKAGIFYWNPRDPAIFVEKRFGVGWSMNFAKPISWLFIIGIIALVLIPSLLMT